MAMASSDVSKIVLVMLYKMLFDDIPFPNDKNRAVKGVCNQE
jgi:hypothetical protein